MRRYLLGLCLLIIFPIRAHAATDPQTSDTPITATVPQATSAPGSDTISPSSPILVRPVDGTMTSDRTPEFVWLRSTDPNSNYVVYTVYLNGVATYLGVSDTGNSSAVNYTSTVYDNERRVVPTIDLNDGIYIWKVRATDASGNYNESTIWSLTIDTVKPPLTIEKLGPYSSPTIDEGTIFEVNTGATPLTIHSDPFVDVRVTITDQTGESTIHTGKTDADGRIIFTDNLTIGTYTYQISATDAANNTTLLPDFSVIVQQAEIIIPLPGVSPPPVIKVPTIVTQIGSHLLTYPATVSQIVSRSNVAILLFALLAIGIVVLLILLKKRTNLVLRDRYGQPIDHARVIHTRDNHEQVYDLLQLHHGQLYIDGLTTHSLLRIELATVTTHLCLSVPRRQYVITLT